VDSRNRDTGETTFQTEASANDPNLEELLALGNRVAPDFFRTLGIPFLAGRDFTSANAKGNSPVFIADGQIVVYGMETMSDRRVGMGMDAVGKLKPGVTLEQAKSDMDAVANHLAEIFPDVDKDSGVTLVPLKENVVGDIRPFLLVLFAAVGFVLLIACATSPIFCSPAPPEESGSSPFGRLLTHGDAVMDLLRDLHRNGATICMVTHDPRYAEHAERTVHLFDGKITNETSTASQIGCT
jgi:hypothetical protein